MTDFFLEIRKTVFIIVALIAVGACIFFSSRKIDGIVLVTHSIVCFGLGIWITIKCWDSGKGLLFGSLYFLWALADLGWSLSYFILNLNSRSIEAIAFTESFYCLAFLAGCSILITNIEGSKFKFFANKFSLLPLLIASPVAVRLIVSPFLMHSDTSSSGLFNMAELLAILSSYLLLFLALLAMISTRSFAWGRFCCGMVSLVFGDWTMRVDKLLGHQAEFELSSFLVLFGLYFSATALLSNDKINQVSTYNSTSLKSNVKLWMLVVLFSFLSFYCLTEFGSLESLKALSIAVCLGTLITVFASEALVSQVLRVSEQVGLIFKAEVAEEYTQLQATTHSLPFELKETYELVFASSLKELKLREERRITKKEIKIQRQVAHDIRSPLTALYAATEDLNELHESKRILVRSAVARIQDIANNLLTFQMGFSDNVLNTGFTYLDQGKLQRNLISTLVLSLISEKRLQYRSRLNLEISSQFDANTHGSFSCIHPNEFKRVLSNLINNSAEAINDHGKIIILLKLSPEGRIVITVKDSGIGIAPDLLLKFSGEEINSSKVGGTGLGLTHARETIENWGGRIAIRSSVDLGTEVAIDLPLLPAPEWFTDHLDLRQIRSIVVLDDDASIHHVWTKKFATLKTAALEIKHFSSANELSEWMQSAIQNQIKQTLFLIDYELIGQSVTGIEIIKKFGIFNNSILVTSRFEETDVLKQSQEIGLRIMPKTIAAFASIDC